jgi:hypothetical protein
VTKNFRHVRVVDLVFGSLRSATRPVQQRCLNFSSRMSGKQFDYCNKYLTLFQITLQTATFGWGDAMFALISTLSNTSWVAFTSTEIRNNACLTFCWEWQRGWQYTWDHELLTVFVLHDKFLCKFFVGLHGDKTYRVYKKKCNLGISQEIDIVLKTKDFRRLGI